MPLPEELEAWERSPIKAFADACDDLAHPRGAPRPSSDERIHAAALAIRENSEEPGDTYGELIDGVFIRRKRLPGDPLPWQEDFYHQFLGGYDASSTRAAGYLLGTPREKDVARLVKRLRRIPPPLAVPVEQFLAGYEAWKKGDVGNLWQCTWAKFTASCDVVQERPAHPLVADFVDAVGDLEWLKEPSPRDPVYAAALNLRETEPDRWADLLAELLHSRDLDVRAEAALWLLGSPRSKDAEAVLRRLVRVEITLLSDLAESACTYLELWKRGKRPDLWTMWAKRLRGRKPRR